MSKNNGKAPLTFPPPSPENTRDIGPAELDAILGSVTPVTDPAPTPGPNDVTFTMLPAGLLAKLRAVDAEVTPLRAQVAALDTRARDLMTGYLDAVGTPLETHNVSVNLELGTFTATPLGGTRDDVPPTAD